MPRGIPSTGVCSVEDCQEAACARGMCRSHYGRAYQQRTYYADVEAARRYQREWVAANKDRVDAHKQARTDRLRAFINEAKTHPCMDCGGTFPPPAMDFDHVRGAKSFQISSAPTRRLTIERVKAEMAKCELVCANCHRVRTHERRLA